MDFFTKVTEFDIKKYNYWVNFDVLPRLVLDYNEKRKSVEDMLNSAHYSDGSKVYNKLRKRMQIQKNFSDKNPDKIFIMVSTPSNNQICEVALACIAINTVLHNALLLTLEYTFNSTYVICEPTTTTHGNFGINLDRDSGEQFGIHAYNIASRRWNEMISRIIHGETKTEVEPEQDQSKIQKGHSSEKATLEVKPVQEQSIGSRALPPQDLSRDDIKQSWPLIDFARIYGRMSVCSISGKDGSKFKSCRFSNNDGYFFVAFSKELGVLSAREIAEKKNNLLVVLKKSGDYILCSSDEVPNEDPVDSGIRVKIVGKIDVTNILESPGDKLGDSWDYVEEERFQRNYLVEELFKLSDLSLDEIERLSDEEIKERIGYYLDIKITKEEKEAEEERQRFKAKVGQSVLYDYSGDDSSLDPRFW